MPAASGSEADNNGKTRFLTFWTTLPGILTGVAAVITATVGLITLLNSGSTGNETPASSLGQAQVTTPATSSTMEPAGARSKPDVRANGSLTMARGDYADLERGLIEISPNADLIFGPESTPHLFATASAFLAPRPGRPTKRGCANALSARRDPFEILPQLDTRSICVSTSEGHVAAVTVITAPGAESSQLRLAYSVWR